jgi:hypothetical protein
MTNITPSFSSITPSKPNFQMRVLKDGLKRIVNEFPDSAFSATSAVS